MTAPARSTGFASNSWRPCPALERALSLTNKGPAWFHEPLGAQDRAHAGQGFDDLSTFVRAECLADLPVVLLDALVKGQKLTGEVANQLTCTSLTWELGLHCLGRDGGSTVKPALFKPGGQPLLAGPADRRGRLVFRQQDDGPLGPRSVWPSPR